MTNWYDNIPAPVDASGREVPLDTKELVCKGETRSVVCYLYGSITQKWYVEFADGGEQRHLNACTLPDSWERLEDDARNGLCEYFGMGDAEDCKGCHAYGNRLSLGCNSVMARDLVRRAKALAGVSDGE